MLHYTVDGPEISVGANYASVASSRDVLLRWRFTIARATRRTLRRMYLNLGAKILTDPIEAHLFPISGPSEHLTDMGWAELQQDLEAAKLVGWSPFDGASKRKLELVFELPGIDPFRIRYQFLKPRLGGLWLRSIEIVRTGRGRADSIRGLLGFRGDEEKMAQLAQLGRSKIEEIGYVDAMDGRVKRVSGIRRKIEACIDFLLGDRR